MTYVNPGSVLAIIIIFPILAALGLIARVWCYRLSEAKVIGIDSYFALASCVGLIACSIDLGIGRNIQVIGYHSSVAVSKFQGPDVAQLDKIELAYNQLWIVSNASVKLTFLLFYRRLLGHGRAFLFTNAVLITLVISWCICFFFLSLFQCGREVDEQFNPIVPPFEDPKYCLDTTRVFFANSITDCALDLAILIMPMPIIWRLKMALRTRLAVSAIFALGGFCVVASALRVTVYAAVWAVIDHRTDRIFVLGIEGSDDYGIVSLTLFWSQVELGVASIACNLPCIKPVFTKTRLNEFFSSIRSRTSLSSLRARIQGDASPSHATRLGSEPGTELKDLPHGASRSVTATVDHSDRSESTVMDEDNIMVQTKISTFTD